MNLREQFKKEHPETIGEKDIQFDDGNYIDWLESKLEMNQASLRGANKRVDELERLLSTLINALKFQEKKQIDYYISLSEETLKQGRAEGTINKEAVEFGEWLSYECAPSDAPGNKWFHLDSRTHYETTEQIYKELFKNQENK